MHIYICGSDKRLIEKCRRKSRNLSSKSTEDQLFVIELAVSLRILSVFFLLSLIPRWACVICEERCSFVFLVEFCV